MVAVYLFPFGSTGFAAVLFVGLGVDDLYQHFPQFLSFEILLEFWGKPT
jgi:hypothetical protein